MTTCTRGEWLKTIGGTIIGAAAIGLPTESMAAESAGEYTLPPLPYPEDALEPHLDARTLAIHKGKHHAGYVRGLNSTLAALQEANGKGDYAHVQALSRALAFHGSGHVLHTLYFSNLGPKPKPPSGALRKAIDAQFGSVDTFQAHLAAATNKVAGSGWGMLAYEPLGGRLVVLQIEKHENQILCGVVPLLVIDVWEHAYYLNYQNRRADYTKAIMNVIHWEEVARRHQRALRAR